MDALGSIKPKIVIRNLVCDVDAQHQATIVHYLSEEQPLTVC
jgi:hypothetical protein